MVKMLRKYQDFSGGLSEVANDQMRDNQLAKAQNTVPGDGYGIAKAHGTIVALPRLSSGETIIRLVTLKPQSSVAQTLAFTADKLYRLNGSAWTQVTSGLQPIKDWFIQANKLWWLDGEKLRHYDGTQVVAATLGNDSPSQADKDIWARVIASSCVEYMDGRWFYARTGANEVIFTEVGEPNKIKSTNIFNFDTKNAETITALQVFNEGLLVFKESSIDFLQSGNFETAAGVKRVPLNVTSGTAFAGSVQVVENAVLYLGVNGVYRLRVPSMTTIIAAENISEQRISSTIKNFQPTEAFAAVWDGVYHLNLKNAVEQMEYRYYLKLKAFFGPFTQDFACYATGVEEKALYLGCQDGYVLRYDDASHDYVDTASGQPRAIKMEAMTKGFDVTDSMVRDAKIKRVLVAARQYLQELSLLHVFVKADYSEMAFDINFAESLVYDKNEFGSSYWGWKDTVVKEFTIGKKAKRLQFTFRNESLGQPVLVYGVACVFKPKRPKGSREDVSKGEIRYED